MENNNCIFCEEDLSGLKFREDYQLYAWCDDKEDPSSLNKPAKCAHINCFHRFLELNAHRN